MYNCMIRKVTINLVLICCILFSLSASAQFGTGQLDGRTNTINTAVPFLRISPDARAGAMGDAGVATSPDANSMFWNLSKVAFAKSRSNISVTYTPWLKELVNDVFLANLSGYYQLDEMQTVSASLRYFSLGTINFTDITGMPTYDYRPREFAFDAGYARKLSDNFSIALAGRYIYSNLASGDINGRVIKPGTAFATDVSFFYTKDYEKSDNSVNTWNVGLALTNIGTKISYTESATNKDFLPTNFGLGTSYTFGLDETNKLMLALDLNKLMVPTPDSTGAYRQKSTISGMFSSFGDAPGGFGEELKEFTVSMGGEYAFRDQFFVRAGYFYENKDKGNRKYVTAGLGVKYNMFGLNFSYLVPSGNGIQRNPLSNTLRFSLIFDLDHHEEDNSNTW
ncbi:type IX secretion system outer membrane channel protein PorV [Chitinophaga pinensis]|uniref:Type IX secretion system outer membrane channel protein PorV n=1 Tax=Chitinophaga pinensis TaxID=79329 RepID=A0A5C6LYS0_9BACT|nr:type IX secretion system outer membrane channel protein PorV [Chitinophaga pinensis]TWW00536.1 type IX secretion system outer membrane channel protein PorV [Chitinophaga pinensis]